MWIPALVSMVAAPVLAQDSRASRVLPLIEAERAFGDAAASLGTRRAFLEFLSDDAVLFRPGPVRGREWLLRQPDQPGLLEWEPALAEMSRAGDLGYTTGPWRLRVPGSAVVRHGQYVTIWRRQSGGEWRAVIDHGIATPEPEGETPASTSAAGVDGPAEAGADLTDLLTLDRRLASAATVEGAAAVLGDRADASVRVLRDGSMPEVGPAALRTHLPKRPGDFDWAPAGGGVSDAGDLGYTYGEYETVHAAAGTGGRGTYLRIWRRRDGEWWLVLDLAAPMPSTRRPEPGS